MHTINGEREGYVLVVGAAGVDTKATQLNPLQRGSSVPGSIQSSLGGVGRNIAENLARLEIPTVLLTVLGDDRNAKYVIEACKEAGIDMSFAIQVGGESTGGYVALLTPTNDLDIAISDYHLINLLTPELLKKYDALFADAALLVIDANLSRDTLAALFDLAAIHKLPVCADPTSVFLASKLCEFLPNIYMVAPNAGETEALCGLTVQNNQIDDALRVARQLVSMGVDIGIITLAEYGVVYADSSGGGHVPAIHTHIVDPTGAGDAFTAGVIFGLLNGVPLDEAMRLGVSAATLTLRSRESVLPELSQELLFDALAI